MGRGLPLSTTINHLPNLLLQRQAFITQTFQHGGVAAGGRALLTPSRGCGRRHNIVTYLMYFQDLTENAGKSSIQNYGSPKSDRVGLIRPWYSYIIKQSNDLSPDPKAVANITSSGWRESTQRVAHLAHFWRWCAARGQNPPFCPCVPNSRVSVRPRQDV